MRPTGDGRFQPGDIFVAERVLGRARCGGTKKRKGGVNPERQLAAELSVGGRETASRHRLRKGRRRDQASTMRQPAATAIRRARSGAKERRRWARWRCAMPRPNRRRRVHPVVREAQFLAERTAGVGASLREGSSGALPMDGGSHGLDGAGDTPAGRPPAPWLHNPAAVVAFFADERCQSQPTSRDRPGSSRNAQPKALTSHPATRKRRAPIDHLRPKNADAAASPTTTATALSTGPGGLQPNQPALQVSDG